MEKEYWWEKDLRKIALTYPYSGMCYEDQVSELIEDILKAEIKKAVEDYKKELEEDIEELNLEDYSH